MPTRPTSIAKKLTRMNMLVSAIALLLACIGFVVYDSASYRAALVSNLSVQAQEAGSNSVSALLFDDPQSAQRTLSSLKLSSNIVSAAIYSADGKLFATYLRNPQLQVPRALEIPPSQEETHRFDHGDVMLTHTIVFQNKLAGVIFIESDLQRFQERLRTYISIAAGVLALSLIVALFVSRIARRAIAEPVIRLADVARSVSQDRNYSLRVSRGKEGAELAVLVETFNEMLEQIQQRDTDLRKAHSELEQRVEDRTAELAAANRELEAFSYSVSHDLRAPLRSIDGFSLALLEDYGDKLDSAGQDYLHRVRSATQRMGILIDDLLNLSRVTRTEMHKEPVDLSGIARSAASDLMKTNGHRNVEWVIEDGVEAFGDSRLLRIVLDNLLGNSWKYTSKHDQARIEFGRERSNASSVYYVKDDGAGFDPAYSERLFGAFQRLHGITEFPGTGVGLATVYRIVQRHGGRVWAEGAVEKGVIVRFTL